MSGPLDSPATAVPSTVRAQLVLVEGRTFAISDQAGQMLGGTHGLVHDDLRHLSELVVELVGARLEVLASAALTPLSAMVVSQPAGAEGVPVQAVLTRRRWLAGGLREDIHVTNNSPVAQRWTLRVRVAADFAHVFDVKASKVGRRHAPVPDGDGWRIDATQLGAQTRLRCSPPAELAGDLLVWHLAVPGHAHVGVTLTAEPVVDGIAAGLAFPIGVSPAEAIPMRRIEAWQASVPRVVSSDPRLSMVVDRALEDLAALRIVDPGHADRAVVAAGAPWFMTLFGRDSLLTSWMALPFAPSLATGVLATLADLQGRVDDQIAEEQPGKILHELRRRGGGGPFADRERYYGSVDATALFVILAGEAARWGALSDVDLVHLAPAVDAAVGWLLGPGDGDGDGFVDYQRSGPTGLSNQGWKDSWDGVTFADGSLPSGRIGLAEVQGYTYAALIERRRAGGANAAAVRPDGSTRACHRAAAVVQRAILGCRARLVRSRPRRPGPSDRRIDHQPRPCPVDRDRRRGPR